MTNIFTLILLISTLTTGIFWCLKHFKLVIARRRSAYQTNQEITNSVRIPTENNTFLKSSYKHAWIEVCASIFPVLLLVFIVRSFIFEPFQIPSGSMMPTLLIGDFILVKKFAYGIKDPITQSTLIETGHPKRGDIVVFKYPLNPNLNYIKRVIGLPGDKISYDLINKRVMIQPKFTSKKNRATIFPVSYSELTPSDFVQTFNFTDSGKVSSNFLRSVPNKQINSEVRLAQRKELLGSAEHNILIVPGKQDHLEMYYQQPGCLLAEWIVPKGEYFMLGDNRDNSSDSRFWGFVPQKNLVGKAIAIWMNFDKQEGRLLTGIHLSRIGTIH